MTSWHEASGDYIGENVGAPQLRHVAIQALDIRQSATQYDDIRIKYVHDTGERARKTVFVALQRCFGALLTVFSSDGNFVCG